VAKRLGGGGSGGMLPHQFISKKPTQKPIPTVSFDEIGGLNTETKAHILKSLELFKKADESRKAGMKPAKHMIFYGPPGTGKTQIAKAIANKLNVPFFSQSGSSFVQLYVGAGAMRVRELFEEAKKNAPCVIFIDEIDALASKRGGPNRSDEVDRTLNEFLVHMNGVDENDQILIIGATNQLKMLDEAILRPGRFDHKIYIGLPDLTGRQEIIEIHAKKKPLAPSVRARLGEIAKSIPGFSGADIEGLLNRALENALVNDRKMVIEEDMDYAMDYAVLGAKGSEMKSASLRKRVAYHEAGHALVQSLLGRGKIRKATILPRGDALGFVAQIPDEEALHTEDELFERLHVCLAGGVAERLIFGKHANGVGGDLQQAKQIIDMMVESGMGTSEFAVLFDEDEKNKRKESIFTKAFKDTEMLISSHSVELEELTQALLEQDTLSGDQIDTIVHDGVTELHALPKPTLVQANA
jgi:cell division protease FtsH